MTIGVNNCGRTSEFGGNCSLDITVVISEKLLGDISVDTSDLLQAGNLPSRRYN
jgi:hypothetical protein